MDINMGGHLSSEDTRVNLYLVTAKSERLEVEKTHGPVRLCVKTCLLPEEAVEGKIE